MDLWVQTGEGGHWNLYFSRPLNNWELAIVEYLFSRLQGDVVDSAGEDKVVWMNFKNNKFLVRYLYAILEPGDQFPFQ